MILYNDDCFNIFPKIEDNSIDMILCDPPYGTTKNAYDKALPFDSLWPHLNRIIKPNAAIVLFGQNPFSSALVVSNYSGYKHTWHWDKKSSANFAVAKYMPLTVTEDILVFGSDETEDINYYLPEDVHVFTKAGKKVFYYPLMKSGKNRYRGSKNAKTNGEGFGGIKQVYYQSDQYYPTNLLEFSVVPRRQSLHPSQKPVDLLEYLVKTYSLEGQVVLDFTMGVGSTGVACQNLNRNFIGIEKDTKYFDVAKERLS